MSLIPGTVHRGGEQGGAQGGARPATGGYRKGRQVQRSRVGRPHSVGDFNATVD